MLSRRRVALASAAALLSSTAQGRIPMTHIALLGDSIIDNKAYVGVGPDVTEQLRSLAPPEWQITRLALDGAVSSGVLQQLQRLPGGTTHIVISAGGNDALGHSSILEERASSVAGVLRKLADIQDGFRSNYAALVDAAARRRLPTAVCTVYDPRYPDPLRRRLSSLALSVINDIVTREVFSRDMTLMDLRLMLNEDGDFANPIEPSVQGGMKLAHAIKRFVSGQSTSAILR
jgi:hypothetical protein